MKTCYEHIFSGTTTPMSAYDSTKTNLGQTILQDSTGNPPHCGPCPIPVARPMEASTSISVMMPSVVTWSDTIDWIFLADNASAANTRRSVLYEFNKSTGLYTWKGFVTCSFPFAGTQGTYTVRGFSAQKYTYSTGTVSTSGSSTTLTGSGTAWQTARFAVGARIGFGSTDPTAITTWYNITAIGSDTSITLNTAANVSAGTSFVIEEIRLVWALVNGTTATNGGLFVTKGLNYSTFTSGGTAISAATTTDNTQATSKLSDAATTTMTTPSGFDIDDMVSNTEQYIYFLNGAASTNARIFKFNIRAGLTLSSGQDTSAFILQTGNQAVSGTVSSTNNGLIATLGHGPGSGVKCFYFVSTTRIHRVALTNITASSTTFIDDVMLEIPPGSTTTFPATSAFAFLDHEEFIDRLIVITTGATAFRHYVTQYRTDSGQMDHIWGSDDKVYMQSTTSLEIPYYFTTGSNPVTCWTDNGFTHVVIHGVTAYNQMIAIPTSCDYNYNPSPNDDFLILPKFNVSGLTKAYRVYFTRDRLAGGDNLGLPTEGFKTYYRTSGIDDNSGTWIAVPEGGDLTGIAPASEIQFAVAFKIFGGTCIPTQLYSCCFVYEDGTTDSHYNPSLAKSSIASRIFAWRQVSLFGSNIPDLRIRLYNAETAALVLDDTVDANTAGTWEYSTDGTSWNAWSASADTVGNYIRYTADSLPNNITVKALLTQ